MDTQAVLDYPVHVGTIPEMISHLMAALTRGQHQHVVTLNPEMVMRGESNPDFGRLLKSADLVLPDGAGVVWALRRKGVRVNRIPGIEFSEALMAYAESHGLSIALIGASPEVNTATREQLLKRFPKLHIVLTHHGYFPSTEARQHVARTCAEARPDMVFVALGVPGQEAWIAEFKGLFEKPAVFVGVGGSFDVWSGLKQRAHPLFLKLNMEWLYRITSEPWRLKRVYNTLPMFVVKIVVSQCHQPRYEKES